MPRKARLDAPGTLHHIIIRGIEKKKIVDDRQDRQRFSTCLGEITRETNTAVYAWSLKDSHAHFLIKSGPEGILTPLVRGGIIYKLSNNLLGHRR